MRRLRLDVMVAVSLAVVGSLDLLAAAKPPKPQPVTATLTFRCFADDPGGSPSPCDDFVDGATDRIRDDGLLSPYVGSIDPSGLFTPLIATPGSGRVVNMLFGLALPDTRTCGSVGNCHPNGATDGEAPRSGQLPVSGQAADRRDMGRPPWALVRHVNLRCSRRRAWSTPRSGCPMATATGASTSTHGVTQARAPSPSFVKTL